MAKYNLLTNSLIESLTTSGTGNVDLTVDEKASLYDGNTTVSGISLIASDILHLEVDMYNRIKVENIKIYLNTTMSGISNEIEFYYKDDNNSDFVLCPLEDEGTFFWPYNLPELFAPRFIRLIINNLDCELLELGVYNDDTQVAFGQDGNKTMKVLENYEGYDILEVFNNSDKYVNAYVTIDYQGKESDSYIKLSNSPDGEYIGINNSFLISNDDFSSDYYWSQGQFDRVEVYKDSLRFKEGELIDMISYGIYTTPVINLKDKFMYTYLITDQTSIKGEGGNIYSSTWGDVSSNINTVKIRSSDTAPLPFRKFFLFYLDNDSYLNVCEGNLENGHISYTKLDNSITSSSPKEIMFDKQKSQLVLLDDNEYFRKYKYISPANINSLFNSGGNKHMQGKWGIDYHGNIFGQYESGGNYLLKYISNDLSNTTTLIDNGNVELAFDLSIHPRQNSCWFSDSSIKTINRVDSSGDKKVSVPLSNPTYVCALRDGGCWVVDSGAGLIKRLSLNGEELNSIDYNTNYNILDISYGIDLNEMLSRYERFWVLMSGGYVLQYNFKGEILSNTNLLGTESIYAFTEGCLAFNHSSKFAYQLNKEGVISRTWDFSSLVDIGTNLFISEIDNEEYLSLNSSEAVFPVWDDPVWGDYGIEWQEVNSDGYMLPMLQYHQLKYKINTEILEVPIVNPSMETGDSSGWNLEHDGTHSLDIGTSYAHDGVYGGRAYVGSYDDIWFSQFLDLTTVSGIDFDIIDNCKSIYEKGYFFTLNVFAKLVDSGSRQRIRFKYYDAYFDPILPEVWEEYEISKAYWEDICVFKKLLSGTRFIKIELYIYSRPEVYFDNWRANLIRSPHLDAIKVPKPVKLNNIGPQSSKPLYIKTDFPPFAVNTDYTTKLKCWWGNEED